MPLLSQRMGVPKGYEPVPVHPDPQSAQPINTAPVTTPVANFPPETKQEPVGNGFTRCPLPPIWQSNPDSLRMFYKGGVIPQNRIYSQSLKG